MRLAFQSTDSGTGITTLRTGTSSHVGTLLLPDTDGCLLSVSTKIESNSTTYNVLPPEKFIDNTVLVYTDVNGKVHSSVNIGTSTNPFNNAYLIGNLYISGKAVTASDRNLKSDINEIGKRILNAWKNIDFVQFKMKGQDKIQFGVIAQQIVEAFEKEGLNAFDYNLVFKRDDGTLAVSYEQILILECALLRSKI